MQNEDPYFQRQPALKREYSRYGGSFCKRRTGKRPLVRCGECLPEEDLRMYGLFRLAFSRSYKTHGGVKRHLPYSGRNSEA